MSITVHPAQPDDFPRIADLLIQLYAVELPGALRGPCSGQQQLLQFTLTAKHNQGVNGRYVACNEAGDIIATAVMEHPNSTAYERAPDGTVARAVQLLGYSGTLQLLRIVAQSMIGVKRPKMPHAVAFHSVVVDERYRGQGIGRTVMTALEQEAVDFGYQSAWLQVLQTNQPAHQLYQRLGYEEFWSSPRWTHALTWPSYLMRKTLPAHL